MRAFWVLSAAAVLVACSSQHDGEAIKCGVSEAEFRQAIQEVSRMSPYSGKRVGRCDLIVDDVHDVSVITPEIQQRVEEMIAREQAETKK